MIFLVDTNENTEISPHLALFLGHGGNFIGGQLNIVHDGLLGLVAADLHHLDVYGIVTASNKAEAKSEDAMRIEVASEIERPMRLTLPYQHSCWSITAHCILASGL